MKYVVALVLPFISFFSMGKPLRGIVCLVAQLTIIGWPFASLWALYVVHRGRPLVDLDEMVG